LILLLPSVRAGAARKWPLLGYFGGHGSTWLVGACVVRTCVCARTSACHPPFRARGDQCQISRQLRSVLHKRIHCSSCGSRPSPPPWGNFSEITRPSMYMSSVFGVGFTPTRLHDMSVRACVFCPQAGCVRAGKKD
ncbi:unnamed protein product, partial [Ectocarpus sp. 8 AP-2014]